MLDTMVQVVDSVQSNETEQRSLDQELFNAVRDSSLSEELDDDECRILAGIAELHVLKDKAHLIKEGYDSQYLYGVMNGTLIVAKSNAQGCVMLDTRKSGSIAGALSFVTGKPHTASITSKGDSNVFSFERTDFESLMDAEPRLVYKVMKAIMRDMHDIVARMNVQHVELTNYISKQHGRY